MKRLIIICEGQTEREFCNDVLQPNFLQKGIHIQAPLIKKSGGGIVKWSVLKKQIENHLKQDTTAYVTTFIDYYGLNHKHQFPVWEAAKAEVNINNRIQLLEEAMKNEINDALRYRFIPYIQLHEFEGLLFIDATVFTQNFAAAELLDLAELTKTITDYPNPELLNDGKETAPSKRLMRLIDGYNKVVYGAMLAEEIGLAKIREKCLRFDGWLKGLEGI